MLSQSIQSLASIMPTKIKKLFEDPDIDGYTIQTCKLEFNSVNDDDNDNGNNNVEMISLNATNINDHSIVKKPLKKSKYYLLCILILSISGLVSLTAFLIYRTHLIHKQKQTVLMINELTHFRSIDNQTIQQLTNLISTCKRNLLKFDRFY